MRQVLCLILLAACGDDAPPATTDPGQEGLTDHDQDGFLSDEDCNDRNDQIYPGALEICNDQDDDCDGDIDEDVKTVWYYDGDGDGYGDPESYLTHCDQVENAVTNANDCDDDDPDVNPGARETCDGLDENCNLIADEGVRGTKEECPAESCLEIFDDGREIDGDYWIWWDDEATQVECDMQTNEGGWTLILRNDMKNDLDPGWDPPDLSVCGSWGTMLGGYELTSDEEITNDLFMGGVPHNQLHVSMTYAAIDKWNGDTGYVELDGEAIFDEAIDNSDSADGQVCGSEGGGNNTKDSQHSVDAIVGHTSESVLIVAGSTLNGSASAASFGIDEVEVWIR